jgi:hypothetical protein
MRYLLTCFLFAALIAAAGCGSNGSTPGTNGPTATAAGAVMDSTTIQWIDSTRDLGKVEEGQKVEVAFRFRNTGDKPLIIAEVKPGCGCTAADQSREPVAPGADGTVKATFDSKAHPGTNHKTLSVSSNSKGASHMTLYFTVEVEKKK